MLTDAQDAEAGEGWYRLGPDRAGALTCSYRHTAAQADTLVDRRRAVVVAGILADVLADTYNQHAVVASDMLAGGGILYSVDATEAVVGRCYVTAGVH